MFFLLSRVLAVSRVVFSGINSNKVGTINWAQDCPLFLGTLRLSTQWNSLFFIVDFELQNGRQRGGPVPLKLPETKKILKSLNKKSC